MISPTRRNLKPSRFPSSPPSLLPPLSTFCQQLFPQIVPESMRSHSVLLPGIPTAYQDEHGLYYVAPLLLVATAVPMTPQIAQVAAQMAAAVHLMTRVPHQPYTAHDWWPRLTLLLARQKPFRYWAPTAWRTRWLWVSTQRYHTHWMIHATNPQGRPLAGRATPWLTPEEWQRSYGIHKLAPSAASTQTARRPFPFHLGWRRHWGDIASLGIATVVLANLGTWIDPAGPVGPVCGWTGLGLLTWALIRPWRFRWLSRYLGRRYWFARAAGLSSPSD